jgi:alpha-amylase
VRPVTLVLIVHDHQPVGNFEGVFREAYENAYAPFLGFLETHPGFRIGLHTSGPLLQWLALHQGDYLKRLRLLVDRGQVELWGGGFFEPILPAIPEADRRGQIRAMSDWLELELGRRPRGLWLTERVWEPELPSSLAQAGVRYTAVDDAHFVAAGFERDQLWGYALTEDQGDTIAVLPIHRELRYRIPFAPPEATIELLREVAAGGEGRMAVLGDDGEKFGVWPGTHRLCYEEGWLERFAAALEAHPWIELRLPSEAVEHHVPLGLAYLPSAAYHEMQEWSLPPRAQARYRSAAARLEPEFGDGAHDLLRGGHWRNFLVRYPESNRLHKRALRASRLLWQRPAENDPAWREVRTRLWRAQCNCPYWHGVFGGLYLPHLRSALYRELIAAETSLGAGDTRLELGDLDLDGEVDALLEGPAWAAWISARGARLWAFDDRRSLHNWGDTLARRSEAYHEKLRAASVGGAEGKTIHGDVRVKEPGLAALAETADPRGRDSFLDRWHENGVSTDWAERRFVLAADGLQVAAAVAEGEAPALTKRYRRDANGALEVEYALVSERARRGELVIELNLALHVPRAPDRWVEIGGRRAEPPEPAARARHEHVRERAFVDGWADRRLDVTTDAPATLERGPIETVSLSEAGAERVFQGVELLYRFPVTLEPGRPWTLRVQCTPGPAEARGSAR